MIKIVALNEVTDDKNEEAEEFEEFASKEAQETLVVSEYYRALKFKQDGKLDSALNLFKQLLEAQVVHEITEETKENKLFSVKYNCFRNIGLIYEQKGEFEKALANLVEAIDLDENDVFTQYKIGKLALKQSKLFLAKVAFTKCLEKNKNHWPSKDGLLETLCLQDNVLCAYEWALQCYNDDKKYERAIKVILEVREKFNGSIPLMEDMIQLKFVPEPDCKIKYDPKFSVFPPYKEAKMTEENYLKEIPEDMKIFSNELNWITFGNVTVKLYNYMVENGYNIISWFRLEDFIKEPEITEPPVIEEPEKPSNENSMEVVESNNVIEQPDQPESSNNTLEELPHQEETEASKNPELPTPTPHETRQKTGSRKRCTDLNNLEQWGWHKNRRSNRKKSIVENTENVDLSLNGFIRRWLSNYFTESFTTKSSPFIDDENQLNEIENSAEKQLEIEEIDLENFNELSKDSFNQFLDKLRNRDFDVYIPAFEWLRFVSSHWTNRIPNEICSLYKKIYEIYEYYIDYTNLIHHGDETFRDMYRMAVFYFELVHDEIEDSMNSSNKLDYPEDFMTSKEYLQGNIGFMTTYDECTPSLMRIHWLNYCIQKYKNNFHDALNYLYKVEEILEEPDFKDTVISLKNVKHNKLIDYKTVKDLIVKMERKINLISVKKLYDSNNFKELVEILKGSIVYSTEPKVNIDSLPLKIQSQIEVLLESLWRIDNFEECFCYAEKALKYSVDNFLVAPTEYRLSEWASLVNYCLTYIEAIISDEENEPFKVLMSLNKNLSRLVQTLGQIISHQLDSPVEKNSQPHLINSTIPWTILYHLIQREDDLFWANWKYPKTGDEVPNELEEPEGFDSLRMFFVAHEFLGRKQLCSKDNSKLLLYALDVITPILKTPLLETYRDVVDKQVEQMTYCLYGYPTKKARLRHIEEHDSEHVELTFERAIQLYDIYCPDTLPEFDSFKLASISSDMEQLLLRIIALIPKSMDVQPHIGPIKKFINGSEKSLPKQEFNLLPHKLSSIYYLLADFYFKNQETLKSIRYYMMDLTIRPERFDAWAGLALTKANKLEMKLNSYGNINVKEFMEQADNCARCFEQCLSLKDTNTIWAEFGSFSYNLQSFCSRNLKQCSENLSMESFTMIEEYKERYLTLSHKCFTTVNESEEPGKQKNANEPNSEDNHEERWFYHFMLGKIAEKKKEHPSVYLEHYLKSAKYLYENNATYPIKINHSNPSDLSVEALEVYYRITSAIMKYLEQHSKINKPTGKLFHKILKELSTSPFAYNRAKINEDNLNALKRKLEKSTSIAEETPEKVAKVDGKISPLAENPKPEESAETAVETNNQPSEMVPETTGIVVPIEPVESKKEDVIEKMEIEVEKPAEEEKQSPITIPPENKNLTSVSDPVSSRRGSRESAVTSTTSSSTSSDSSSTDSSSSESDDTSTSEDDANKENEFLTQDQIDVIYKICIKNLEECVTRFPEHYKSIYRLTYHFLNASGSTKSLEKCKQLLLGSYKTALGNTVQGLYTEKKTNNFFNGIWRIPSQEIDRPGNFTSHLSKCVIILMEVLKRLNDFETLLDLGLHLQKTPEADKKYLNDNDRKELCPQAITFCIQTIRNLIKEYTTPEKKERELLNLMVEIFKSHRKCVKHMNQNQAQFSAVLADVYRAYVKDRITLSENANVVDLAVKMCQQELIYRKNLEKGIIGISPATLPLNNPPAPPPKLNLMPHIEVKSVSAINKSIMENAVSVSRNSPSPVITSSSATVTVSSPTTSSPSNNDPNKTSGSARSRGITQKPKSSVSSPSNVSSSNAMNSMLLSMYSDPALFSAMMQDPNAMTTVLTEYYKMIALGGLGESANKTSNMDMLGGLASMFSGISGSSPTNTASPTNSPLPSKPSSSKSASSYEMKYLESLANKTGTSALLSKQPSLSISATSSASAISSVSASLSNLAKSGTTASLSSSSSFSSAAPKKLNQKESQRKSTGNPGFLGNTLSLPVDLPKSLSITPAVPSKSCLQPNIPSKSTKMPEKHKSSIKRASSMAHPYKLTNSVSSSLLESLKTNPSLSITPDTASSNKGPSLKKASSNQGQGSLASYTEFLKNYSLQSNPGSLLMPQKPTTSGYKKQQKSHPTSVIQQVPPKLSSIKNALPSYDLSKNISNFSAMSKVSPIPSSTKSMPSSLPSPHQRDLLMSKSPYSNISGRSSTTSLTPTPPLSTSPFPSQISPPKTLQQKLAERQKQNQQNQQKLNQKQENAQPSKSRKDSDVIILDE